MCDCVSVCVCGSECVSVCLWGCVSSESESVYECVSVSACVWVCVSVWFLTVTAAHRSWIWFYHFTGEELRSGWNHLPRVMCTGLCHTSAAPESIGLVPGSTEAGASLEAGTRAQKSNRDERSAGGRAQITGLGRPLAWVGCQHPTTPRIQDSALTVVSPLSPTRVSRSNTNFPGGLRRIKQKSRYSISGHMNVKK